jgi:hypothetical protein
MSKFAENKGISAKSNGERQKTCHWFRPSLKTKRNCRPAGAWVLSAASGDKDFAPAGVKNSPAIHVWMPAAKDEKVPRGTAEVLSSQTGLLKWLRTVPSTKVPGYCQSTRRGGLKTCPNAVGAEYL